MQHAGGQWLEALSELLWRKRQALERLIFKLAVARIVLSIDNREWLAMASDDVAELVDEIEELDRGRIELLERQAGDLDVALTLASLAVAASRASASAATALRSFINLSTVASVITSPLLSLTLGPASRAVPLAL